MGYKKSARLAKGSAALYFPATKALPRFSSIKAMVEDLRPSEPVHCLHPEKLYQAARLFVDHFPGHSLYAVKANPDPYVLTRLFDAGITHFDVASLGEIKEVRALFPHAHLAFMNPVKSRQAIRSAYFDYAVRDFVIDTADELQKIFDETDNAADLLIVVRLAMPKGSAAYSLTDKYGCDADTSVGLLKQASLRAARVGLSFHVGSQTTDPASYADAIRQSGVVIAQSGIELDVFNIGGGFPIPGLGMEVPPLTSFFDVIRREVEALRLPPSCEVWSEPGRALSGTCSTLVVRVELRKPSVNGDLLYINDGTFGNMFEVCSGSWKNGASMIRLARKSKKAPVKELLPFRFYGPTCDSVDYMPGPFTLPCDINEGDWIALEGMGAYMAASQSRFNGFYSDHQIEIVSATELKLVDSEQSS